VSAENRLTADQIAALSPGDAVTIESGAEFGRRRYATATVVRLLASHVGVIPDFTRRHTGVNIQKFVLRAHSLDELLSLGRLTSQAARLLEAAVASGPNLLVVSEERSQCYAPA
jgi:hypothetical protein